MQKLDNIKHCIFLTEANYHATIDDSLCAVGILPLTDAN